MRARPMVWLVAGALAGCAVGPDFQPPPRQVPSAFAVGHADGAVVAMGQWWLALNDPCLNGLVQQALDANPDLAIAVTRLKEARTQQTLDWGAALPKGGAAAGAANGSGSDGSRGRVPADLGAGDSTARTKIIKQVSGFDGSWELDLFGRLRRRMEAGQDYTQAAAQLRNVVQTGIIAEVVRTYLDLRGTQMRLAVLRQNGVLARQSRDFVQLRFQRGLTNELDLMLAERELAALNAEEAPLTAQAEADRYALAALVGGFPEQLDGRLQKPAALPVVPPTLNPGLPPEVMARRPDVLLAQWELAAATAELGVAQADLLPRVALLGGIGAQSGSLDGASAAHIWSFGPSAYWPLLDFGALDAQIDLADWRRQEHLLRYKRVIQQAVRQVDTAMADFDGQQSRLDNLGQALLASQRAAGLARKRYDRGLTDFLNVVDAQRQQFELEAQFVLAQQAAAQGFVTLCQSLGGGWDRDAPLPEVRTPRPAVMALFQRLLGGGNADPADAGKQ